MKKFCFFLLLLSISTTTSQISAQTQTNTAESANIYNIYYDDYPCLRATYAVWDSSGNDMRVNNTNDIVITEGGKPRTICPGYPQCSSGARSFSAILVVDMSLSMTDAINPGIDPTQKYLVALSALRNFILNLPTHKVNGKTILTNCEVSIIQFDGGAELITGFTDNQDSLIKMTQFSKYNIRVSTDYNAAFFKDKYDDSVNTALWLAKYARYKPVIVFMTDGNHDANYAVAVNKGSEPKDGRFMLESVTTECHKRRPSIYVFAIKIGKDILDATSRGYLQGLANIEGGFNNGIPNQNLYLDISDANQLNDITTYIVNVSGTVGYPTPCEVEWQTDCNGGGELIMKFPHHNNVSASTTFTIPLNIKPELSINPDTLIFNKNLPPGNYDTTIIITAQQNSVQIYSPAYNSTDGRYSIISWGGKTPPFTLNKGESATITIKYNLTDSLPSTSSINFLGSQCNQATLICKADPSSKVLNNADSAKIYGMDFSNYPCIGAYFRVFDSLGNEVRITNTDDILITEGGKLRTQCPGSPQCGTGDKCASYIFVIDMSLSMTDPISSSDPTPKKDLVLQGLRSAILNLPTHNVNGKSILTDCEVAITQFDGGSELITGFTDDQDSLIKMTQSDKYTVRVNTDYNAALFKDKWDDSVNTALWVAKSARCKPVIVFITDGKHEANYAVAVNQGSEPSDGRCMVDAIKAICNRRQPSVYVFAIKIGAELLDATTKGYLTSLAGIEVGVDKDGQPAKNLYLDITDPQMIGNIIAYIINTGGVIGTPELCEAFWQTDCNGGGDLVFTFPNHNNLKARTIFILPDSIKPLLFIKPSSVIFNKNLPAGNYDTIITITALKNPVEIYSPAYTSTDVMYSIINWGGKTPPFTLNKGESATITIRYNLTDSLPSASSINFLGSQCYQAELLCKADSITVGVNDQANDLSKSFVLEQNYPQPFSNSTTIGFTLYQPANIKLEVMDLLGEQIKLLANGFYNTGSYNVTLNSEKLSPGIYFYKLTANGYSETKKMVLIR